MALETPQEVVDAFVAAVGFALREMASVEAFPRGVRAAVSAESFNGLSAVMRLIAGAEGYFVLSMPSAAARAIAQRVLAEVIPDPDQAMIRDCLGEVANIVAGQAKSLLSGTQYHFRFATPTVVEGWPADLGTSDLFVEFDSDVGAFTFHMCLNY